MRPRCAACWQRRQSDAKKEKTGAPVDLPGIRSSVAVPAAKDMTLSIIVPFYNERSSLAALLDKVLAVRLPDGCRREIILVDDGSDDGSGDVAAEYARRLPEVVRLISSPQNHGKGHAVRAGLAAATGDVCIIQDADLEYDPEDYCTILEAYEDPSVKVVYGSRILGSRNRSYSRYYWGGRLVSFVTNLLFGSAITDEPTCYKSFRREVLDGLELRANGFEFCPEITGKLLRAGYRIEEVPIRYTPRSFEQGKKIRARDGLLAIWTLLRVRTERKRRDE